MKVLTNNQYYSQIANVIREQNGTNNTYKPAQMVSALKDLFYEEMEGVPPISFQGIGENLLDYRIDGASGGVGDRTKNLCPYNKVNNSIIAHVESGKTYSFSLFASFLIGFNLMKRNASSQSTSSVATKYNSEGNVSVTFTADEDFDLFVNGFSLIPGKTFLESVSNFQLEESSTVTDYEPYGYKVPVVVNGKNLFDEIYPNIVINTVKYISFALTNGEYTLSSNIPNGGSASLFLLAGQVNSGASSQNNGVWLNNPQTVNVIDGFLTIGYRIYGNMNPEDYETILVLGSTATDYEPYHDPTTTNIYLDEPIEENESISLSDTNVNIPTIKGTNILSVDTTVQPSKVYVKARKESSYETAMREDYEEQLSDIESALQEV